MKTTPQLMARFEHFVDNVYPDMFEGEQLRYTLVSDGSEIDAVDYYEQDGNLDGEAYGYGEVD